MSKHICMSQEIVHVDARLGYEWPSIFFWLYICVYMQNLMSPICEHLNLKNIDLECDSIILF